MDADFTFSDNISEREMEKFVGIEIYSTPELKGIGGIYKHSYKDFIVKEIIENGNILEFGEEESPTMEIPIPKYKYTTFNLVKVNRDTFDAIRLISKTLKIPTEIIGYAGLKDKCSLSVQRASIPGNYIEKLKKLNIRDIFIRDIGFSKKAVRLGNNWGNKFIITIRNLESEFKEKNHIEEIISKLNQLGFPNYYGLQRFGTFRPNSHLIGRYILEDNFKKAYEEFVLNTYSTELDISRKVRTELKVTGNLEKAYDEFPKSLNYERGLIQYLLDHPNDYEGAINNLPSYLIKLIISSFQSYLFNKILSLRIQDGFSLFNPVKGDVISILDDINGQITQVKYKYGGSYDKFLKEAINLNRASIVIPLIGYDTDLDEYPFVKPLLIKILQMEKLNPEIFNHELLKTHDFKGSFRSMLLKPKDLNLINIEQDELFQNKLKVKIECSLSKGSYATMLLRELMKT
jgi:tRNA pseudouridine13 synthase